MIGPDPASAAEFARLRAEVEGAVVRWMYGPPNSEPHDPRPYICERERERPPTLRPERPEALGEVPEVGFDAAGEVVMVRRYGGLDRLKEVDFRVPGADVEHWRRFTIFNGEPVLIRTLWVTRDSHGRPVSVVVKKEPCFWEREEYTYDTYDEHGVLRRILTFVAMDEDHLSDVFQEFVAGYDSAGRLASLVEVAVGLGEVYAPKPRRKTDKLARRVEEALVEAVGDRVARSPEPVAACAIAYGGFLPPVIGLATEREHRELLREGPGDFGFAWNPAHFDLILDDLDESLLDDCASLDEAWDSDIDRYDRNVQELCRRIATRLNGPARPPNNAADGFVALALDYSFEHVGEDAAASLSTQQLAELRNAGRIP